MTQLELNLVVPEPPRARAGTIRAIRLGERIIPYRFRRARRRTIGIVIDRDGLAAAAPRWVTIGEVEAFLREKQRWILQKLAEAPLGAPRRFAWGAGARLPILDGEVVITPDASVRRVVRVDDRLHVPAAADTVDAMRAAVLPWIRLAGHAHFVARVAQLAPMIDVAPPTLALSNARTQWGSCSIGHDKRVRIRLHWKLLLLPSWLGDYVVAHELAHVREMNHSARFWRTVAVMVPDYANARRALRDETRILPDL